MRRYTCTDCIVLNYLSLYAHIKPSWLTTKSYTTSSYIKPSSLTAELYTIAYQVIFVRWKFSDGWTICENFQCEIKFRCKKFSQTLPVSENYISSVNVNSQWKLPNVWYIATCTRCTYQTTNDCITTLSMVSIWTPVSRYCTLKHPSSHTTKIQTYMYMYNTSKEMNQSTRPLDGHIKCYPSSWYCTCTILLC